MKKHWLSIGVLMFVMTLGILVSCSRQLASVPTIPATPTNSPTITNTFTPVITNTFTRTFTQTFTNTPCIAGGNTCTMTLTFTHTNTPTGPTATPTNTPAGAIKFEDWEGPYPSGNMWAGFAVCGGANYFSNPYASGAAITTCYDSTPADPYKGSYTWKGIIQWLADSGQAQLGLDSAYGGSYGYPISIAAAPPSYMSIWLKTDTAPVSFVLYFQDTASLASGSPVNTSHYQNGTGADYMNVISTPNVWTNFVIPLTSGTSVWSFDPTTMNWGSILDIGTVFQGPVGASYPVIQNVYFDDYYFYP